MTPRKIFPLFILKDLRGLLASFPEAGQASDRVQATSPGRPSSARPPQWDTTCHPVEVPQQRHFGQVMERLPVDVQDMRGHRGVQVRLGSAHRARQPLLVQPPDPGTPQATPARTRRGHRARSGGCSSSRERAPRDTRRRSASPATAREPGSTPSRTARTAHEPSQRSWAHRACRARDYPGNGTPMIG